MSSRPCGVRLPGGTPHSGHGSAEYWFRRAVSQVGARTPWRLTITTYTSRGAAASGQAAISAQRTIAKSRLPLTIESVPEAAGIVGLVELALIDEDRAALVITEHLVGEVQAVNHRGEPLADPEAGLGVELQVRQACRYPRWDRFGPSSLTSEEFWYSYWKMHGPL